MFVAGYGQNGQFAVGQGELLEYSGQMIADGVPVRIVRCQVREGDSGGGVFNPDGRLAGVLWGCNRDGTHFITGQPLRKFLDRIWPNRPAQIIPHTQRPTTIAPRTQPNSTQQPTMQQPATQRPLLPNTVQEPVYKPNPILPGPGPDLGVGPMSPWPSTPSNPVATSPAIETPNAFADQLPTAASSAAKWGLQHLLIALGAGTGVAGLGGLIAGWLVKRGITRVEQRIDQRHEPTAAAGGPRTDQPFRGR